MDYLLARNVEQTILRQLAQRRETVTSAFSLYSPNDGTQVLVKKVYICNTSASIALYSLFHDEDGTTYDQSTSLYYDKTIAANQTEALDLDVFMGDSSGNLAAKTSVTSALTFSVYGEEVLTRAR